MDGTYGLAAIFVILLLKEIGIPVPIPSDLLMIGAGAQAALGEYGIGELAVAVAVAVTVGVTLQFVLFRSFGRAVLERAGGRLGLSPERRAAVETRLRAGGARAVFVGLNVPGARAAVVAVAGLAALPLASFAPAAIAGTLCSLRSSHSPRSALRCGSCAGAGRCAPGPRRRARRASRAWSPSRRASGEGRPVRSRPRRTARGRGLALVLRARLRAHLLADDPAHAGAVQSPAAVRGARGGAHRARDARLHPARPRHGRGAGRDRTLLLDLAAVLGLREGSATRHRARSGVLGRAPAARREARQARIHRDHGRAARRRVRPASGAHARFGRTPGRGQQYGRPH
ncbi:MAG: hypothetical protein E6G64_17505 [Actinobacteria bacterium]|nr:MAG: hypothetical protein E6G64_17505 [Actinomycetota bacterium]